MPLYATTEARERLRQSVLDRHEVTLAQFDTSLVWYSEHMTRYSQIYDNVSARLRDEDNAVKTLLVERKSSPLTRPGDSIDVWNKEPYFMFEPRLYRHILLFNVLADDNFRENDIFQLSMNFAKLPQGTADKVRVTLVIRHRNDSIYTVSKEITRFCALTAFGGCVWYLAYQKNTVTDFVLSRIKKITHKGSFCRKNELPANKKSS